jgi:hypothetical protein
MKYKVNNMKYIINHIVKIDYTFAGRNNTKYVFAQSENLAKKKFYHENRFSEITAIITIF